MIISNNCNDDDGMEWDRMNLIVFLLCNYLMVMVKMMVWVVEILLMMASM